MIALLQGTQSTSYSNYDAQHVQDWQAVQSRCHTGPLPATPQPPATNITALPGVTTSDPANSTCLSANHYTIQPGDDVQKIAVAHGVATGTLIILNGIFPDGTNLFVGQDLYVPVLQDFFSIHTNSDLISQLSAQTLSDVPCQARG